VLAEKVVLTVNVVLAEKVMLAGNVEIVCGVGDDGGAG